EPLNMNHPTLWGQSSSAAGHGPSQGAACMPGGGYAIPGIQTKRSASRGVSRVAQTGNSA
ncbi:hypothetical protein, partial [Klebsiella pneumoniae]|uniref:hypothetical protein n=1 Tax=Klebsiella pneumoniae TaxID=573 RepID=UPI001D0D28FE